MSLGPIIADGVSKDMTRCIETTFCYRLIHGLGRLKFGTCILVPKTEGAIRANSYQGAMYGMERYVIYSIDVLITGRARRTVTLEGKVVLWIYRLYILDGNTSLNAAQGIT